MYNEKVAKIALENAPQNAKYTSHHIQKYILYVLARRIRNVFVKKLAIQNFALLLMKHEMSLKKNKWLLF